MVQNSQKLCQIRLRLSMPGIRKPLIFRKIQNVCTQQIYKNDHIIDIHVNTEVLTTGLVKPSGTKRPPAVASTQWCK